MNGETVIISTFYSNIYLFWLFILSLAFNLMIIDYNKPHIDYAWKRKAMKHTMGTNNWNRKSNRIWNAESKVNPESSNTSRK